MKKVTMFFSGDVAKLKSGYIATRNHVSCDAAIIREGYDNVVSTAYRNASVIMKACRREKTTE